MAKAERTNEFALDSCVDRSTAISTRVRLFRLFLLIPCWESQRLIPKRSAGPRATKIGVVSLKALDHHRPNREESAVLPLNSGLGCADRGRHFAAVSNHRELHGLVEHQIVPRADREDIRRATRASNIRPSAGRSARRAQHRGEHLETFD